jgi:hypothetical protein
LPRRVSLPHADDLFRPTVVRDQPQPEQPEPAPAPEPEPEADKKGPSKRVKHDEKMTVYITSEELLEIEHARLTLRRTTGSAVDRGRLVREAVAMALADLEENGEDSVLVQRLTTT